MQMIRVLERLWDGKNLRKLNLFKEGTSDKAVEKPKKTIKLGFLHMCMLRSGLFVYSLMVSKG